MAFSLKDYRKTQLFLTRVQVAQLCFVSKSYIEAIESHKIKPVYHRLPVIARAYRLPLAFLSDCVALDWKVDPPENIPLLEEEPYPVNYSVSCAGKK